MNISGVMLGTADSKKLAEFYTLIFGRPGWEQDDWFGYKVGNGTLMIGPHSLVKGKNPSPARIMLVIESDDVKTEFNRYKAAGADIVAEPYQPDEKQPEVWLATVADPDNNYIQLATPWNSSK